MDKIGITASAGLWGFILQQVPSKMLLASGLLVNALSVALFAVTQNGYLMYTTKMLIGFTEGLQWVWAPLWVARWADDAKLPLWINLSGCVAAGVGNGIGTLLAGSSTANGLPYAFSFQVEAAVLVLLFLLMLLVPSEKLAITSALTQFQFRFHVSREETVKGNRPRVRSGSFLHPVLVAEDMTVSQQLEQLFQNKLYCRSAMAFASSNYINAGLAFIWIRLYMSLWTLHKQVSVVSFLIVTGVGGAMGIAVSSGVEGSSAAKTLAFLKKAAALACVGSLVTIAGYVLQLLYGDRLGPLTLLIFSWTGILLLTGGVAGTTGLIQIVCNNSVEDEKVRSFGVGLAQGILGVNVRINNLFGNSFGPLLPQMVMDLFIFLFRLNEAQALFVGAVSVAAAAFVVLGCVVSATQALEAPGSRPPSPKRATTMPAVVEERSTDRLRR
eukprot:g16703.t1